jgi:ssRNA-specific RNase YbeY (16S rRNA maturation enzyme)
VIHGVLHLVGFDDLVESDRDEMRRMEDFWLSKAYEKKYGF